MSNQLEYDIFLSYNWDHKAHVQKLFDKLSQLNLKVWIDDKELAHTSLTAQLANGITKSRVFMCCISKKYSESENCKKELFYAILKKKPMIVLMFEHFNNILEEIKMEINTHRR